MSLNRILAFSSSRAGSGGFLETAAPVIGEFLGNKPLNVAFIPFAAVGDGYEEYATMVKQALQQLPYPIETVTPINAKELITQADVVMVGGGNTFKLLHDIYAFKLLDLIRDKINRGIPYIGWSAGANITGPTIGTTNDMPVIEPHSFNALGFFPFQINPHYTNVKPAGHHGETRDQRLEEFCTINPGLAIVGLPEGTALKLEHNVLKLVGDLPAVLFSTAADQPGVITRTAINVNEDLSFLM